MTTIRKKLNSSFYEMLPGPDHSLKGHIADISEVIVSNAGNEFRTLTFNDDNLGEVVMGLNGGLIGALKMAKILKGNVEEGFEFLNDHIEIEFEGKKPFETEDNEGRPIKAMVNCYGIYKI